MVKLFLVPSSKPFLFSSSTTTLYLKPTHVIIITLSIHVLLLTLTPSTDDDGMVFRSQPLLLLWIIVWTFSCTHPHLICTEEYSCCYLSTYLIMYKSHGRVWWRMRGQSSSQSINWWVTEEEEVEEERLIQIMGTSRDNVVIKLNPWAV